MSLYKETIGKIFREADITIGGNQPWDIQVHNEDFYKRILIGGSLALGESYMDGWWDVEHLDQFFYKILRIGIQETLKPNAKILWQTLLARLTNRQSSKRAFQVGEKHYDIGNDLYQKMLDPHMQYTCAYWKEGAMNLGEAQEAKLALIAEKLQIEPGMRILDAGCGFGGLSRYLADRFGAKLTSITISKEQAAYAEAKNGSLPIDVQIIDYRDLRADPFDRIVAIGLMEHIGYKNYRLFMEHMHRLLKDDGIFLCHTIGSPITTYVGDPWSDKYIFPNGMLPSIVQIGTAIEKLFVMEDWHNFGASYDKTLMAWYQNTEAVWSELSINNKKYDERFHRMWTYYLLIFAGAFRARHTQLWQLVLTKKGIVTGYTAPR